MSFSAADAPTFKVVVLGAERSGKTTLRLGLDLKSDAEILTALNMRSPPSSSKGKATSPSLLPPPTVGYDFNSFVQESTGATLRLWEMSSLHPGLRSTGNEFNAAHAYVFLFKAGTAQSIFSYYWQLVKQRWAESKAEGRNRLPFFFPIFVETGFTSLGSVEDESLRRLRMESESIIYENIGSMPFLYFQFGVKGALPATSPILAPEKLPKATPMTSLATSHTIWTTVLEQLSMLPWPAF